MIEMGGATKQKAGTFNITSGINRPRHVFIWINNIPTAGEEQLSNPFLYNTFNVANDKKLASCHLEVGHGNLYPDNEYRVSEELPRVFRDVLKYSHSINDYRGGTLLTRLNFESLFSIVYFDLRSQKQDIKDGTTKLTFKYSLSAGTNKFYAIYALVLYEQDIEIFQSSGKLMLRS